tara:strand:- start:386 stop:583 length:198 start_codon:yes stop_codon:yes gene_type:complete
MHRGLLSTLRSCTSSPTISTLHSAGRAPLQAIKPEEEEADEEGQVGDGIEGDEGDEEEVEEPIPS